MRTTHCPRHGAQGIGLVCGHIARALYGPAPRVGFYWSDDSDLARPDAWCQRCEADLVALDGADSGDWFDAAGFKVFCAACWDEARDLCGSPAQG